MSDSDVQIQDIDHALRFGFRVVRSEYFPQNGVDNVLSLFRLHSAVDSSWSPQLQ